MIPEDERVWPEPRERTPISGSEMDAHLAFVATLLTGEDEEEEKRSLSDGLLHFGIRFVDTLDLMRQQAGLEEKGADWFRIAGEQMAIWLRGAPSPVNPMKMSGEPRRRETFSSSGRNTGSSFRCVRTRFSTCLRAILNATRRWPGGLSGSP